MQLRTREDVQVATPNLNIYLEPTLVLLEKGLVLEGSTPKIEDKQVPGMDSKHDDVSPISGFKNGPLVKNRQVTPECGKRPNPSGRMHAYLGS